MAQHQSARFRSGGAARAAGRLVALVGLGFGAGLLIGVLTEEPTLLIGHLRGEGETVTMAELERESESGTPPDAVVEQESRGPESLPSEAMRGDDGRVLAERIALQKTVAEQEVAVVPSVAAAAPIEAPPARPMREAAASSGIGASTGEWAIQVGAFSEEAAARALQANLQAKDYPVALVPSTGGAKRWRVRVQPVQSEELARGLADRLKRDEKLPTWVVPLEARAGR
jgi:DedD protein